MILSIERGNTPIAISVYPKKIEDASVSVQGLGFMPVMQKYDPLTSIQKSVSFTIELIGRIFKGLVDIIIGQQESSQLGGLFSIAKGAKDFWNQGLFQLFEFMAVLSVSLGVLNLLPIPVLDGGHILFCMIEWIKGSPVSEKIQEISFRLGLYLLLGIMIFAHWNDLKRFGVIQKIQSLF
jgi:regulator of sigma E protease